jgi:hypothetical protein
MKSFALALALALSALGACGPGIPGGPTMNSKIGGNNELPPPTSEVVSKDILEREPVANTAEVKHILISWKDLAESFDGRIDPRAAKRTKGEAESIIRAVLDKLKKGEDFDGLMRNVSEDPGSAASARAYSVTPDAKLVIEFRQLSLRLKVNEIGVCQSDFGFHVIKRLE